MTTWRVGATLVLVAAAGLFLARLGDRGLVSEEVRWAEAAREMVATGDYLRPAINGQPYPDKPAGSYWLIVLAAHVTGGVDEATARLPAALAGVAGVALVIWLGRRLYGPAAGLLAGAVLATSFGYAFYARRATADVETVTGTLAAVCLYEWSRHRPGRAWVVGLWLLMAVTSLTKGLLGFVLPVVVMVTHATWSSWWDRHFCLSKTGPAEMPVPPHHVVLANRWLLTRWTLLAAPLAVAIYLLPFLLAAGTGPGDGLAMVWRENVRRFVNPHNHTGPPYLYLGVIWVLAAPWCLFLPAALVPPPRPSDGDRLARAYFWAVFLFFTASASRRSYYLLPVLPAVALLVGRTLTAPADELRPLARRLRTVGWWLFGVAVVAVGAIVLPPSWLLRDPYDKLPPLPDRPLFVLVWLTLLGAFGWAAARRPARLPAVAALAVALGFGYLFGVAMPATDALRTRKQFAAEVRRLTDANPDRLALFHARDAVFDLGRTVPPCDDADQLAQAIRDGRVRWVLARRRYLAGVTLPARVVAEEAGHPWEAADQAGDKLVLLDAGS